MNHFFRFVMSQTNLKQTLGKQTLGKQVMKQTPGTHTEMMKTTLGPRAKMTKNILMPHALGLATHPQTMMTTARWNSYTPISRSPLADPIPKDIMGVLFWLLNNESNISRVGFKILHAKAIVFGLGNDDHFVGVLMSLYSNNALHEDALELFTQHKHKRIHSWNNFFYTLAAHFPERASTAFAEFEKTEIIPDLRTFRALLTAHSRSQSSMEEVWSVVEKMKKVYGLEPDVTHYGSIIYKLMKVEDMEKVLDVVAEMECRISDAICNMVFARCRTTEDLESAKTMAAILARKHKPKERKFRVAYPLYMNLKTMGIKWPECVKSKSGIRLPGKSWIETKEED